MALYKNERCPVCLKPFEKGDDVVTCPECGTPHHRECYKDYGGCKNRSLHGTDFVYKKDEARVAELNAEDSIKNNDSPLNAEIKSEYYELDAAAEANRAASPIPEITGAQKNEDEIDGVKTEDIASVIAINQSKFLQKFRKNKKLNWNWSAFVFGPYYFFFRKMYIPGAVLIAIEYAVRLIVSAIYVSAGIAYANAFASAKTPNDYLAATQAFMEDPEYVNYMTASTIILVSLLVIHIVCALIADNLYRKKVVGVVKAVEEKLKMGESFSLMGPVAGMESNLSQKDMRRMFLARQGGVSTLAPLLAFIIPQLLAMML